MKPFIFFMGLLSYKPVHSQDDVMQILLNNKIGTLTEQPRFSVIEPDKKRDSIYKIPSQFLKHFTTRTLLFKTDESQRKISILLSKDSLNRRIMVVDKNMNRDFTDEMIIKSPLGHSVQENTVADSLIFTTGQTKILHLKYVFEKPDFIQTDYGDEIENNFFLMVGSNSVFLTKQKVDDKLVWFAIYTKHPLDYSRSSLRLALSTEIDSTFQFKKNEKPVEYKLGDSLIINNSFFYFDKFSFTKSLLTLRKLSGRTITNAFPGFFAYDFQLSDIHNKKISLRSFAGSFTLLEFWGTWCKPCKEITPKLKEMNEQLGRKNFKLVSIAYDKTIEDVKEYVVNNDITWTNIFQRMDKQSTLISRYKVEEYPTYILIDINGKIIFRNTGLDGFLELEKKLEQLGLTR